MQQIGQMSVLFMLAVFSIMDVRTREIPESLLRIAAALTICYQVCFREVPLWELAGGAAVGAAFFLVSFVTREGIGYGDSWGILILGGFLGLLKLLEVLTAAFFLLAAAAVLVLTMRKMRPGRGIPFFPFLTCGYLIALVYC